MAINDDHPDTPQLERDAHCSFVTHHVSKAQSHFLISDVGQEGSQTFSDYHNQM
jgi:hypothetical protein